MVMSKVGHLWAVGYDDEERAHQLREKIIGLGWEKNYLQLEDVAVVARHADGSFTLDRKPFPVVSNVLGSSVAGLFAGLVLGAPLTGAAVGAVVGAAGSAAVLASAGVGDDFIAEVKQFM